MSALLWTLKQGNGPILGTAIHSGHIVRPDIADILNVDDATRFREEDPYTDELTAIVDSRLIVHRSRFEMDLNRNRNCAIYTKPEDAWGIEVWKHPLEQRMIQITLQQYDAFYRMLDDALATMLQRHAKIVVLDFHSYNHQRQGPNAMPSPPAENPEIEIGTDTMDRRYWTFIVDPFIAALRDLPFRERRLDVRENVKFGAGWMSQWIHNRYPTKVCVISIELKKTFMDEWSGTLYRHRLNDYKSAFQATVPVLQKCLRTN